MAGQKNCRYVATAQGATHWETDPVIMVWWPADVLQMHPQAVKPLAVLKGFIAERYSQQFLSCLSCGRVCMEGW